MNISTATSKALNALALKAAAGLMLVELAL
jgi:hypothetical protein